MLFRSEWWAIKKRVHKISIVKKRMIRSISEKTTKNWIRNEKIQLKIGVPISEKTTERHMRWFDHVQGERLMPQCGRAIQFKLREQKKGRGRPKITQVEIQKKNMIRN